MCCLYKEWRYKDFVGTHSRPPARMVLGFDNGLEDDKSDEVQRSMVMNEIIITTVTGVCNLLSCESVVCVMGRNGYRGCVKRDFDLKMVRDRSIEGFVW